MKSLKMVRKSVVIGGLAAAFLLGGTVPGLVGSAHAAEAAISNAAAQGTVAYDKVVEKELSYILGRVALYADKTDSAIREALQQGKTLVQASGLNRDELYDKLVDSMNQRIDFAAQSDKAITADNLHSIKSEAAAKISAVLSTNGYSGTQLIEVDYDEVVDNELSYIVGRVALYSNKTDGAIREALQQGKSLAQASGLNRDELYDKLVDSMNQRIDFAAQSETSITADRLNRIKSEAAAQISTVLSTQGYNDAKPVEVNYGKTVDRELSYIIGRVALYSDKTDAAIREALQQGKTLTQASGLNRDELYDKLVDSMNQRIDFAAQRDKTMTADRLNPIKSEAAAKIATALSTNGFAGTQSIKVDYDEVMEKELSYTIGRVALYSDKTDGAIREVLKKGGTLVQASGLMRDELYSKLVDSMNQRIDFAARSDTTMTADRLDRIKSEAAAKISTALSKSGYGQ